jgi:hypothetical protein
VENSNNKWRERLPMKPRVFKKKGFAVEEKVTSAATLEVTVTSATARPKLPHSK